jgi:hypothetical protein
MPKFNLYIPANVIEFYDYINDVQTFDFFSTDQIFVWLNLAKNQNDQNNLTEKNSIRNLSEEYNNLEDTRSLF